VFRSADAAKVHAILENECGAEALSCKDWTPEQMERIRFAVVRLGSASPEALAKAVKLAQRDWRDLLMAAGFGENLEAHNKWYSHVAC